MWVFQLKNTHRLCEKHECEYSTLKTHTSMRNTGVRISTLKVPTYSVRNIGVMISTLKLHTFSVRYTSVRISTLKLHTCVRKQDITQLWNYTPPLLEGWVYFYFEITHSPYEKCGCEYLNWTATQFDSFIVWKDDQTYLFCIQFTAMVFKVMIRGPKQIKLNN